MARAPKVQFFRSCSDFHICTKQPCNEDTEPIIGYFPDNVNLLHVDWLKKVQELGTDYDRYAEGEVLKGGGALTNDEKRAILNEKKHEKPIFFLGDIYKHIPIFSFRKVVEKLQFYYREGRVFDHEAFAPLATPTEFTYTGVFLMNNAYQGILHSFLRHYLQWQILVPFIEVTMHKLKPLHLFIELVSKAPNIKTSRAAIFNFTKALNALSTLQYNDCQGALNEVQLEMVKHLQTKLTYDNYRGEGLNDKSQMEVYFRIQEGLIIVLGFSRELFRPEHSLMNTRPVRALVTAYFIEPDEHSKRMIVKSF